jgi:hypothetical protein
MVRKAWSAAWAAAGCAGVLACSDGNARSALEAVGTQPPVETPAGVPPGAGSSPSDAGTAALPLPSVTFPSAAGWTFYGPAEGLPQRVLGVTTDEGGNLWVAGGEEGLFLLRPGEGRFRRFGLADGLHPYGYLPNGADAPGPHHLEVLSVAGAGAGTVLVGYAGKPGCEHDWDGPSPDPSVYKSGDVDRVTLVGDALEVVHYDVFSGPGVVAAELRGREKLCSVFRIAVDRAAGRAWFGANHGFAMGDLRFGGAPACNGQLGCAGVLEHVHPAVNAWGDEARTQYILLTGDYRGVAVDPRTHDAWFAGATRTTRFTWGTHGGLSRPEGAYWEAQVDTEATDWNRLDVWPDAAAQPTPSERKDDLAFDASLADDGSLWVASPAWGLAHLAPDGKVLGTVQGGLVSPHPSSVQVDVDGSVWAGARWGGGLSRLSSSGITRVDASVLGPELAALPVSGLHLQRTAGGRRLLVAFDGHGTHAGALGVYEGK